MVSEICITEFKTYDSHQDLPCCYVSDVFFGPEFQSVHPSCWLHRDIVNMTHTCFKRLIMMSCQETVHLTLCLLLIKWGKLCSSYSTSVVCLYCTCLLWFAVPFYQVTVPSCCFSSPSQSYLFHFVQPVSAVALQGYKPKFGLNKHLICSASLFFCRKGYTM